MRFTAAILALLIALLSCLPCADLDAAPAGENATGAVIHAADGYAHGNEGMDLCSPFCHCACCAVASEITVPLSLQYRPLSAYGSVHFHEFRPAAPVRICVPVWEPPR